jgi:hypothetical protein
VFLRARYYNPAVGRFITADSIVPEPVGSQGWNKYGYVGNNPIRYIDPSGHCILGLPCPDWIANVFGIPTPTNSVEIEVIVDIVIIQSSGITQADTDKYIQVANDVYKQAQVTVKKGTVTELGDQILNISEDGRNGVLDDFIWDQATEMPVTDPCVADLPEIDALLNIGSNNGFTAYFVPELLSNTSGRAYTIDEGGPGFTYSTAIDDLRTFPHEMGHLFTLPHVDDPDNIMKQGINSGKNILIQDQIQDIRFYLLNR